MDRFRSNPRSQPLPAGPVLAWFALTVLLPVGSAASRLQAQGAPPAAELSAEALDRGRREIYHGFKEARGVYPLVGFQNLPRVWAAQLNRRGADYQQQRRRLTALEGRWQSDEFKREVRRRYGLFYDPDFPNHEHPDYDPSLPNDGLPLGLTRTIHKFSVDEFFDAIVPAEAGVELQLGEDQRPQTAVMLNCRSCHTMPVFGSRGSRLAEGLSNVFFDYERFHNDVNRAAGLPTGNLFVRNPDRNSFVNAADYYGRVMTFMRTPHPRFDLSRTVAVFYGARPPQFWGLDRETFERPYLKTQNWFTYGTKLESESGAGAYCDGSFHGNPSWIMYGISYSLKPDGSDYLSSQQRFARYAEPYLRSLAGRGPKYPYLHDVPTEVAARIPALKPVDAVLVARGREVYRDNCARCHGEYRQTGAKSFELRSYPGVVVDLDVIGTDPLRAVRQPYGLEEAAANAAGVRPTGGYLAPPLHSIWARAPFLHNGSVATVRQLLNSSTRDRFFAVSPDPTDPANYDHQDLGWRATPLESPEQVEALKKADPYARVYDSEVKTLGSLGNQGHTFGDSLNEQQRTELIEFLKTL